MRHRVYVLLDVLPGKSGEAVQALSGRAGVLMVDILESPPAVMLVIEAAERDSLATLTTELVGSVDVLTRDLDLLPAV